MHPKVLFQRETSLSTNWIQQITNTLMNFLLNCHVLITVSLPQSVTIWLFVLKKWKLCKGYIITLNKTYEFEKDKNCNSKYS